MTVTLLCVLQYFLPSPTMKAVMIVDAFIPLRKIKKLLGWLAPEVLGVLDVAQHALALRAEPSGPAAGEGDSGRLALLTGASRKHRSVWCGLH